MASLDVQKGNECSLRDRGNRAASDIPRIRELMHKYANRPMDLADAVILRVAAREHLRKVFTVDRDDFSVYRLVLEAWRMLSATACAVPAAGDRFGITRKYELHYHSTAGLPDVSGSRSFPG
jgi:hypothetical protein